jgi:hypothetical protein
LRLPLRLRSLPLPLLWGVALLTGCMSADRRASWRVYPLQRHQPHDGLAVVSRPGGVGLHIWLDTDTGTEGVCRPRWNPDTARLRNGNGSAPTSAGLAPRAEFFEAVGHGHVRWALRRHSEALCRARAPRSSFEWTDPPRTAAAFRPPAYPPVEERDLLSNPKAVLRAEKKLLGLPLLPEDFANEEPPRPPDGP